MTIETMEGISMTEGQVAAHDHKRTEVGTQQHRAREWDITRERKWHMSLE